ncbi:MAG TPA: hypothetical protein ENN98_07265 [Desulfurivibrio alkaliphilus]|uniref:Doubled CXXCH motif domain-containing protein n=1 Tax=Desulfurivibrio alkaliphilus TaxID=427923 RepID=A0A7C2TLI0_9BACT|nr:hypothetical protein [Desulfurivibrio alkaliphilus]
MVEFYRFSLFLFFLIILVIPSSLGLASIYPEAGEIDFRGCYQCHRAILEQNIQSRYRHEPFTRQRCGVCHAAPAANSSGEAGTSGKSVERRKINWLVESGVPHSEHGFLLSAEQVGDSLVVETHGQGGDSPPQTISVPPLTGLAEVVDPGRPPLISDVQILEVRRGVFLSATIGWRTDTMADARVRYGVGELSQLSPPGSRLSQDHRVVLYDLKPGASYLFAVESRDLFGRTQLSETLSFSTKKPSSRNRPPAVVRPDSPVAKPAFVSDFQRVGEYYLLRLSLSAPANVSLGVREFAGGALRPAPGAGEDGRVVDYHAGLNGKVENSMEVCLGCHSKQLGASHPVNVLPPPGMIVPREYPTLPDGRITCMSCHQFHGSDNPYRLVKPGQRELCVGCHRNML